MSIQNLLNFSRSFELAIVIGLLMQSLATHPLHFWLNWLVHYWSCSLCQKVFKNTMLCIQVVKAAIKTIQLLTSIDHDIIHVSIWCFTVKLRTLESLNTFLSLLWFCTPLFFCSSSFRNESRRSFLRLVLLWSLLIYFKHSYRTSLFSRIYTFLLCLSYQLILQIVDQLPVPFCTLCLSPIILMVQWRLIWSYGYRA